MSRLQLRRTASEALRTESTRNRFRRAAASVLADRPVLGAIAGIGVACLLSALTKGPVNFQGLALPGVEATLTRVVLAVFGSLCLGLSGLLWSRRPASAAESTMSGQLPEPAAWSSRPSLSGRFTGREDLLGHVHEGLQEAHFVALVGMPGVGKTQLTLAYLKRHESEFGFTGWVQAEEQAILMRDYASLAARLGLPEQADQARMCQAVRQRLESIPNCLVVFDNVVQPQALEKYLPAAGRVLVTSHISRWRHGRVIEVKPWSPTESLEFLRASSAVDAGATNELADHLGHLPLALEQALAYMNETKTSPDKYLTQLREREGELLARGHGASDEQRGASTLSVSLQQLASKSPRAQDLLTAIAFLGPDAIPRGLFADHSEVLPRKLRRSATDVLAFDEAIGVLTRYSLLAATQDSLSVHRVLQAVIRHQLERREGKRWASSAVRLVAAAFPVRSDDVFEWPSCQRLLPHALAATRHSEEASVEHEGAAMLLHRAALYLWARADLDEAERLLARSYSMIVTRLGPNHLSLAPVLSTRGKVLRERGRLADAKRSHERALAIREARLPGTRPELAWSLGNLGKVLRDLGELNAARGAHERAVAILEAALGPDHREVAWALANLGRTLQALGDVETARRMHERALRIREDNLPAGHPDIAWSLRNMGATMVELRELDKARTYYERALTIFEDRFAPEHPEILATKRKLKALPANVPALSTSEFQPLFNGVDLGSWQMAGDGRFIVNSDSELETEGGMGLLWYSGRKFKDFCLRLQWKATSPDDNSGVFVRFPDPEGSPWVAVDQGYEIQIDDRPSSRFKTGAIYNFQLPKELVARPLGDWNTYEIAVIGQQYRVILNGTLANDFIGDRQLEGYVGLQNHHEGSRVLFRNITIKVL